MFLLSDFVPHLAFAETWHDGTYTPSHGDEPISFTFKFNGALDLTRFQTESGFDRKDRDGGVYLQHTGQAYPDGREYHFGWKLRRQFHSLPKRINPGTIHL